MGGITPNPKKRSYLLPPGCKDLIDVLQGVPPKAALISVRVNRRICGIDLVEIAPHTKPPICRLVDYGALRYELSKKSKR
jgi:hypothetical protein